MNQNVYIYSSLFLSYCISFEEAKGYLETSEHCKITNIKKEIPWKLDFQLIKKTIDDHQQITNKYITPVWSKIKNIEIYYENSLHCYLIILHDNILTKVKWNNEYKNKQDFFSSNKNDPTNEVIIFTEKGFLKNPLSI